jgi:hypothetical protein
MKKGETMTRAARASVVARNLAIIGALPLARELVAASRCSEVDVFGGARHRGVAPVRHRLWAILKVRRGYSYPKIGALWLVDHSTVVVAVAAVLEHTAPDDLEELYPDDLDEDENDRQLPLLPKGPLFL